VAYLALHKCRTSAFTFSCTTQCENTTKTKNPHMDHSR